MVVFTQIDINGTEVSEVETMQLTTSVGENNNAANFSATFSNVDGRNKDNFTIGDEVTIFAEKDTNPPTIKLFVGLIEDITFRGSGSVQEKITISGRDFSVRLMDETVDPVVFNNAEVSTIVTSIIASDVQDITTNNVDASSKVITHIKFNHTTVFDTIKQLAEEADFAFFVDTDKDLNFKPKGSISSGETLDSTNVISSNFRESDQELYNRVWVYGGRQLSGYKETQTADGGSVFTLDYKPHNTKIDVEGTRQVGGVFNLVGDPGSPTQYLVDFHNQNVIFVSGVVAPGPGDNIPTSGDTVDFDYNRSTPIIKFGEDATSVTAFGPHTKVITDKGITEPKEATDLVLTTLAQQAQPIKTGSLNIQGLIQLTAGQTVLVNLPNENISNITYEILEARYTFNTANNQANRVLSVRVSRKLRNLNDTIKQMILDIRKLQGEDLIDTDLFSRLVLGPGSYGVKVNFWSVSTRDVGSAFVLSHPLLGDLGSGTDQVDPQSFLGDSGEAFAIIVSGAD